MLTHTHIQTAKAALIRTSLQLLTLESTIDGVSQLYCSYPHPTSTAPLFEMKANSAPYGIATCKQGWFLGNTAR